VSAPACPEATAAAVGGGGGGYGRGVGRKGRGRSGSWGGWLVCWTGFPMPQRATRPLKDVPIRQKKRTEAHKTAYPPVGQSPSGTTHLTIPSTKLTLPLGDWTEFTLSYDWANCRGPRSPFSSEFPSGREGKSRPRHVPHGRLPSPPLRHPRPRTTAHTHPWRALSRSSPSAAGAGPAPRGACP